MLNLEILLAENIQILQMEIRLDFYHGKHI